MEHLHSEAIIRGFNAGQAGNFARDNGKVRDFARLFGYAEAGEQSLTHRFRFYLFQLDCLATFRSTTNTLFAAAGARAGTLYSAELPLGDEDQLWMRFGPEEAKEEKRMKAEKAAFRLMHVLGLDYAMVDIGVTIHDRPVLMQLEPFPEMDGQTGRLFEEALRRARHSADVAAETGERALIGADPEFLLVNADGKVVPASAYLPRRGRAGCDLVRIDGKVMYPLAELRPEPSSDPRQLVTNIRRAMLAASEWIPDKPGLRWLAGGMPAKGFALGGHIHLSGIALNMELLRVLDNYLALPLVLVEDERSKARRPRYGVPGDVRRKPHGGFEYRTLPSWLVSPRVAKGVLALTALIARHYRLLRRRPLAIHAVMRSYIAGSKLSLINSAAPLLDDIRGLPDFERYESMVSPLFA
ncbi:MAG: hypothetical protein K0Q59_1631, partial [Paenibacillus sp.]|nr:hypothetical protein [Paenibacillus sp.]